MINSVTFVHGPFFKDTTEEQRETYFPSLFGGSPFTIFYKDSNKEEVIQAINQLMSKDQRLHCNPSFAPYDSFRPRLLDWQQLG